MCPAYATRLDVRCVQRVFCCSDFTPTKQYSDLGVKPMNVTRSIC